MQWLRQADEPVYKEGDLLISDTGLEYEITSVSLITGDLTLKPVGFLGSYIPMTKDVAKGYEHVDKESRG